MSPTLAISAANIGQNVLQSVMAPPTRPVNRAEAPGAINFQTFLSKASASPELQQASFLISEGIRDRTDAQERLADLGAEILQDPQIQMLVAPDSSAVEMHFLPDGAVSVKTSDGRQKTVHLAGENKEAAKTAALLAGYLQTSSPVSTFSASHAFGAPGIKIAPGIPEIRLLPSSH